MLTAINVGADYQHECATLIASAIATDWPDLHAAVDFYKALCQESAWRQAKDLLPALTCLAVNAAPANTLHLTAAYQLASLAAIVLDDVMDRDRPARLWGTWSVERGALVSHGLACAALRCLARLPSQALNQVGEGLGQALLLLAAAQAQPLSVAALRADPAPYFRQLFAKSSAFYGAFAKAGAQMGSSTAQHWAAAFNYGVALGALMQIRNDYQGFAQEGYNGHCTLPLVLGAQHNQHPLHAQLMDLLQVQPPAWPTIRSVLIAMDVEALGEALVRKYEGQARQAIDQLPGDCQPLVMLLEESLQ